MKTLATHPDGTPRYLCIFCGSPGRLSKEHVLAQHWRNVLDAEITGLYNQGWILDSDGNVVDTSREFPKRAAYSWTSSQVCQVCNNGWMSRLEEQVKPLLSAMALGEPVDLSPIDARLVCKWVAKTALVLESLDDHPKAMNFELNADVMKLDVETDRPPQFLIWLDAVDGDNRHSSMISTPFHVLAGNHECAGHYWRVATVVLGAVRVITAYSGDAGAFRLIEATNPEELMGEELGRYETGTWTLNRSTPVSFEDSRVKHDALARFIGSRASNLPFPA